MAEGQGVQRWDPLSSRQLDLLSRIAEGDDLSGSDGVAHRTSARSLQTRRLVDVSRKAGTWQARITDAGQFYLQHGYHPEDPTRITVAERPTLKGSQSGEKSAGAAPVSDPVEAGTMNLAKQLIERIVADGGTVRVEAPDQETRAKYRRIIHALKQHGLVPAGYHLRHTGRDSGDIVIRLYEDARPDDTDWNRIRLNTRRVTTDPALVFAAIEKDPADLRVTEGGLTRALALIQALAVEARQRGHRLGVNTKTKHPKVYLQIGQTRRAVSLAEEYDHVRHSATVEELRDQRRNPWKKIPEYDSVPSGRLRLDIARDGYDKHDTWVDSGRSQLEKQLRQIIREVEAGEAADEQARQEHRRAVEKEMARQRREDEEREQQWREAKTRAAVQATEKLRRDAFRTAYEAWIAASEIRAFCADLEAALAADIYPDKSANVKRWIAWAEAQAQRLDPVIGPVALADLDFDVNPGPDDLRPFLGKWSPHLAQTEYRSDSDEKRFEDVRSYSRDWHHGMRGKPTWWRRK